MKFGMTPIGTFPHEWVMFHSGVFGYKRANYLSLENWIKVYDGALGTALMDTFTTVSFLRTLTMKQAKLLDGFRQDSGDEIEVGEAVIARLKEFGIDPSSKIIVFSNALDFPRYKKVADYFRGRIKVSAGIGTNITCDPGIESYEKANIVMKLSRCRMSAKDPWEKVIKISDDIGKHMGDAREFEIASYELHLD
jgi:nicotinate phosphoribosyltransferase